MKKSAGNSSYTAELYEKADEQSKKEKGGRLCTGFNGSR